MGPDAPAPYTPGQRRFALVYGLTVHVLFAAAIALMAVSLYDGLHAGWGRLAGWPAWVADGLLLLQFPVAHSWLLGERGRRWLAWPVPRPLGRPLATTTFAGVSSLQLLACFGLWSPLGDPVWTPPRLAHEFLSVLYGLSWLLLAWSMAEAGFRLQSGSLGWRAVWENRRPDFPPLPAGKPLHRVIRQPIYASFALVLWTAPSFTPEKILLATVWTAYCVSGSAMKERRMARIHGEAFRTYQRQVPFWVPGWRRPAAAPPPAAAHDADVIVVGGGPVGLLLANLLGRAGRRVILFEARSGTADRSMAIGVTPPSLEILAGLGLAGPFQEAGLAVREAVVHEQGREVSRLDFSELAGPFDFILSLPQSDTVRLLRRRLDAWDRVRVLDGWRVTGVLAHRDRVVVSAREPAFGVEHRFVAALAAGCDGAHSSMAGWMKVRRASRSYAPCFRMADFLDRSGLGDRAHLFFGPERPVESFPLPGGRRRWIVRSGWRGRPDLAGDIETAVARLTGIPLHPGDKLDESRFRPRRKVVSRFARGRVALCGDAAHVMSPIGGQGMNTGFGDAAFLAEAFDAVLDGRGSARAWMRQYDRHRRRAFRSAAARAALGMRLGVLRGRAGSTLRRLVLRALLGHAATRRILARLYTMRSLPRPDDQLAAGARHVARKEPHEDIRPAVT